MIRNLCTCRAHAIRPYTDGRKGLFLRSIWDYEKLYDPFFDLENVHAESIILLLESKNGYEKWYNLLFDPKNSYAESIIPLFGSNNSYTKWHNYFFDLKNSHAKWLEKISGTCF